MRLAVLVRGSLVLSMAVLMLLAGCARTPQPPPPPSAEEGLKEMAKVYQYIEYSKLPLPQKPEDFRDYVDSMQGSFDRVQSGEFVVLWGVGRSTAPGAGNQILVCEKKAPAEGGFVLLRDGTVKQVTAAEFAAAPRAK
jgi:hypothetical protein